MDPLKQHSKDFLMAVMAHKWIALRQQLAVLRDLAASDRYAEVDFAKGGVHALNSALHHMDTIDRVADEHLRGECKQPGGACDSTEVH